MSLNTTRKVLPIRASDAHDAHARYKMRPLEIRQKDKGQYYSTYLLNLTEVAKDLKVPPVCLAKHFGWELSTQAKWSDKTGELHLKGRFDLEQLQTEILQKFINHYVLCNRCRLPELDYETAKKTLITSCRACGLIVHLKNPADRMWKLFHQQSLPTKGKKNKKSREKKNHEEINDSEDTETPSLSDWGLDQEPTDDLWSVPIDDKAVQQRRQQEQADSKLLESLIQ